VVSSLSSEEAEPRRLYEEILLRPRRHGNRIKRKPHQEPAPAHAGECQLDLFADRTPVQTRGRLSAQTMRANQLRLWFGSIAYVLMCALRRIALERTQLAKATCGTIRLKLLKIGAMVRTSVRRITFAMASGCPYRRDFALAHAVLTNATAC
jgi:Transposase DDE domain group 1